MPDLEHSLQGHDLSHLRMIAETWGLELNAPDVKKALSELIPQLLDERRIEDELDILGEDASAALDALIKNKGRLPWNQFTREYGEVRQMGPGRRDRIQPHQNPISTAEILWYRGLIARAFFDTTRGSEEFCYLPEDLCALIPCKSPFKNRHQLGRAATSAESAHIHSANDSILDHACTLLAALRIDLAAPDTPEGLQPFLTALLNEAGLLDDEGQPELNNARQHLEAPRGEALCQLAQAWLQSSRLNDLHLMPHLQAEGEWRNDPLTTRHVVIKFLQNLPPDTWWHLSSFIADIRQAHPDFQRPAGDYDSWYVKDIQSGKFLRGFEHWYEVDGALIRYLITGPMHWLGMMDLATPEEGPPPKTAVAFRFSKWASALLTGSIPKGLPAEAASVHVRSDGRIGVDHLAPRTVRYQLARFCEWEQTIHQEYRYHLTPAALERALEQGLQINHLLTLLNNHASPVPPNIIKALKRWEIHGTEVQVGPMVVLRVRSPQVLEVLRNSKAARFLSDSLGPSAISIKPGAEEKVLSALLELGFMGTIETQFPG